jgi:hypothetical protein
MSLESDLAGVFARNGWTWSVKGKGSIVPSEDEIERALDEAARMLYNEQVGAQLEVGRLIIKKKAKGHDVYIYVGPFD